MAKALASEKSLRKITLEDSLDLGRYAEEEITSLNQLIKESEERHTLLQGMAAQEGREDLRKCRLRQLLSVPGNIETACNFLYENLVEDVLLGVIFEVHHTNRIGKMPEMSEEDLKLFSVVENNETDIFGQPHIKKPQECCCPSCNRPLSASRFAPHLEKCLGMGRNSSRIASRRIANNCKENAYGGMSDDDDEDWVAGQEKSKVTKKVEGKKRKDKSGGLKKSKVPKLEKTLAGKVPEEMSQPAKYENVPEKI